MNSSARMHQSHRQGTESPGRSISKPKVSLPGRVGRLLAWVGLAMRIRRERARLANMSDHELRDIGLTREQVNHESYRGIADIPPNRLKRSNARRRL